MIDGSSSRFGLLVLGIAGGDAGFQFAGSFREFFGDFTQELRGALFGFGRDFIFHIFAEAG